ncbi:hypothetical protein SISSUDRAFT_1132557 [Sistotremastrum suecicum HHB10207 ss-3]|uniref:Uncharacterized protein n=1 Tax=Sistotremastrum suecicum HHB10207 ss-3 TaxID=1314776 RepID=A0A165YNK3_9AGAM|nr:hypothetical protein SISSUDRAFT_1132557 [Sistotremastrum suecicum HHB10207 ss-3]
MTPNPHLQTAREDNRYPFSKEPFDKLAAAALENDNNQPTSPHLSRANRSIPINRPWQYYSQAFSERFPQFLKRARTNHSDALTAPSEIPGLDLMLAISMTTAFASLTDNTDVLTGDAAISYIFFFFLVWWIWASQVLYNARFRHRDILHCIYAFLTFVVYGALASFTATQIEETLGLLDDGTNQAEMARSNRLPSLNSRGISLVMGFSRILLLSQYFLLLCRAPPSRRPPLWWHCAGLVASTALFFLTYGVLMHSNSESANVAKIVFWFMALWVEGATHYMAVEHYDHESIPYRSAPLSKRMSELFIIILGAGLDQITKSFHSEVGTLGFGAHTIGIMMFSGIIVVCEFALWFINKPKSVNPEELERDREDQEKQNTAEKDDYVTSLSEVGSPPGSPTIPTSPISLARQPSSFNFSDAGMSDIAKPGKTKSQKAKKAERRLTIEDAEPSDRQLLTWFFFNFVFLSCIILTLQAVARLVAFDNMQVALSKLLNLMEGISKTNAPFNATQFPDAEKGFTDLGISFTDYIRALNLYMPEAETGNNLTASKGLEATVAVPVIVLYQTFDAVPDDGSLLSADVDELLNGLIGNATLAAQILADVEASRINSAFWFFGVAGGTLMALAAMNAIRFKHYGSG